MIFFIYLVSFLFLSSSALPPESGSLSSASADYDGNRLLLRGNVLLDHGLGKMTADEASLERQETNKDFPFSFIHLQKEVLLTLKNRAELHCGLADLDFTTLKGTLTATDDEKVVYTDMLKGKEAMLKMVCNRINLEMSKIGYDGKKSDYDLESIEANEGVAIDYAGSFTLHADHATYNKLSSTSAREFQGIVTAYPKDADSQCRLIHEGDIIDADLVNLDLTQSALSLEHPKGIISSSFIPNLQTGGVIHFQADQLLWMHEQNTLTLKGPIYLQESSLGTVTSENEMQIVQSKKGGKHLLNSLSSQGKTTLEYQDISTKIVHKLTSFGTLFLDREHLHGNIESPVIDGKVPQDLQIVYEEDRIAVHADKAALEYSIVGSAFQPVSLALKGNIRLFSRDPRQPRRCGLADRLLYSPSTRTLILAANPSKKVLFWDEQESIRMSANEIHITFDPITQRENVKGVGNVQFTFSSDENSLLKKLFAFYE